jgi:hypothetical protein
LPFFLGDLLYLTINFICEIDKLLLVKNIYFFSSNEEFYKSASFWKFCFSSGFIFFQISDSSLKIYECLSFEIVFIISFIYQSGFFEN